MQNTFACVWHLETMKQQASGPLRANERKRWRRSDDCLGPRGLLCLHFSAPARRGEGFKRSKLFYLWDHNGGPNNTNTKKEKKEKETRQPSAKAEWAGKRSLQDCKASLRHQRTAKWNTRNYKKKRKILSIDHQASWQRQLCGVCHRRFSSSQSAIKDADAELNPFKGRRWAESSRLWSTTAGFINFTMAVMVPPGTFLYADTTASIRASENLSAIFFDVIPERTLRGDFQYESHFYQPSAHENERTLWGCLFVWAGCDPRWLHATEQSGSCETGPQTCYHFRKNTSMLPGRPPHFAPRSLK